MTQPTPQSLQISDKFSENLAQLPEQPMLAALALHDAQGQLLATIENKPGQAGSVRVYAWLASQFGRVTPEAASLGLEIYAEHTADAQANPGKHPNIDRLFQIQASGQALTVHPMAQAQGH
ncbi:DUF2322 family protein [Parvibium lacunae]|uniref:DUF2322 family protein n=1 Tax=Parvibium lacunae TaxID=1888893 RepID=A0A368L477_9BURK|nr:DUF2322 family protein [Parvibium lacunae]RCS58283.1 DUF2322 family protein [Parvibium lacunae]